jgi:hypothetical protein
MEEKEVFSNQVDYKNKTISKPIPDKISDIDTHNEFYDNIIDAVDSRQLDINTINSFSNISRSRNEVYNLLDLMGDDPIISSALEIYAADACEPNDYGKIVWAESDDDKVLNMVTYLLDSMNVDKNAYGHIYSLCKYGDIYLRLYRDSEYNARNVLSNEKKNQLNEDVILKTFSKNDHYSGYIELIKNPAEVFDLTRLGKSYSFLRTHIQQPKKTSSDVISAYDISQFNYRFNKDDVDVYSATEFVHGSLEDNSSRTSEEVTIINGQSDEDDVTYTVKRGQSLLYNTFKIWRELSLLENSVLLNRMTKSSIVRTVSVEVGDMEKNAVRNLLQRVKQMVEQKSAINVGQSLQEYTNPGPMENIIYIPTHDGKGAISTAQIGGDVQVGDLEDLKYWKKKLFASLGIPGQYLGDTEDSTGFNGGSSLSLISSRYAKSVKRIQNAYIQCITDAINLMLLDRGLYDYINRFTIRMQAPTTQEEKDRKDNMSSAINNIQSVMNLLDMVEDSQTKLEILKSLLSNTINNPSVIQSIQDEIDKIEEDGEESETEAGGEDFGDVFGGGDSGTSSEPLDLGGLGNDLGLEGGSGESLPTPGETSGQPEESFYSNNGGELLQEQDEDLPSFTELGISYIDVK